jgi:hypothetical protein
MATPTGIAAQGAAGAAKAVTKPVIGRKVTTVYELDERGEPTGKAVRVVEDSAQFGLLELAVAAGAAALAYYFLGNPLAPTEPTKAEKKKAAKQAAMDKGDILPSGSPLDIVVDFLTGKGL